MNAFLVAVMFAAVIIIVKVGIDDIDNHKNT